MNTPTDSAIPTTPPSLSAEAVEARKDRLDLKPALAFVEEHLLVYNRAYARLLNGEMPFGHCDNTEGMPCFLHESKVVTPQIIPQEVTIVLSRLPPSIRALSRLTSVSYHWADTVLLPDFGDDGTLRGCKETVPLTEFPRPGDHPSRILIGATSSDGSEFYLTGLPKSVSQHPRAGWFYQLHVLLHEFFHICELPRRTRSKREKVSLRTPGTSCTLQSWWEEWERLFAQENEPQFVSRYAATYADDLTHEARATRREKYDAALAEQMCESFVAYMLGIVPNDEGWTDFRTESFGNLFWADEFNKGFSTCANEKWWLIHTLCTAQVLEQ